MTSPAWVALTPADDLVRLRLAPVWTMACRRRRCRYCHRLFWPNPHVKERQIACSDVNCQKERGAEARQNWRSRPRNQSYFRGRYPYLKEWLARTENAGYLRSYRRGKREASATSPAPQPVEAVPPSTAAPPDSPSMQQLISDIQHELRVLSRSVSGIQARLPQGDIQDASSPESGSRSGS